jgi:DNA helicase-2/ATP-dependent DNA helicase PcrA
MPNDSSVSSAPAASPDYLKGLNPAQRAAVDALDGPVLVLAGAGTGKTRVLTTRIVQLIHTRRAWPSGVLAVTFTNKAAREMRERIAAVIGPMAQDIWLGTFHAMAARILRRHAELVGLKSNFTILDTDDQIRLLKQLIAAEGIDDKRWPARSLLGVIDRWKDRGLTPDKAPAAESGEMAGGKLIKLYRDYQQRLITLNACDFGDLMLHCLSLFQQNPEVLAQYQNKLKYILVDEYQDTNVSQYLWLRLLAQSHNNICCVGDDDQSIYGWRGAEVENILRFEKDFPGARIIRLEQNYRSTGNILAAAAGLIAKNQGRLGKTLWTDDKAGDPVRLFGVWDGVEEARKVGDEIEALQRKGVSPGEIAILVRAGFQTREFEERFITLGVPYRVYGGLRFYERAEIRDAVAYLRVIHQPDDDLAVERIINTPRRGLGDATIQTLHRLARAQNASLLAAAAAIIHTDELKPAARKALASFVADLDRWRHASHSLEPGALAEQVLDESGYTQMLQNDRAPEAPGRLENLKELITAIEEFDALGGFLEHVSLVMERNEEASLPQVTLMTLHGAKGLEFDVVFLPGWEEGLFPHQRALDESGSRGLEEERRLAYVGLTRARKRAYVSWAANRRVHNQWQSSVASRFVAELPQTAVEEMGADAQVNARRASLFPDRPIAQNWSRSPGGAPEGRRATIDLKPNSVKVSAAKSARFAVGSRVFHQKFGYGVVRTVEHDRLHIEFEKAGPKTVVEGFVEPAESV